MTDLAVTKRNGGESLREMLGLDPSCKLVPMMRTGWGRIVIDRVVRSRASFARSNGRG